MVHVFLSCALLTAGIGAGEPADLTPPEGEAKVLFINFEGATLTAGEATVLGDDATRNRSVSCVGEFPPFGGGSVPDWAYRGVVQAFRPYAVRVTRERPTSGNYTMALVGPTRGLADGPLGCQSHYGREPIDCGDTNPNNVIIVDAEAKMSEPQRLLAELIQKIAHSYGLEHVSSVVSDYMYAGPGAYGDHFSAECTALSSAESFCAAQHREHCPEGGQNSDAELRAILGEAAPEPTDPAPTAPAPDERPEDPNPEAPEAGSTGPVDDPTAGDRDADPFEPAEPAPAEEDPSATQGQTCAVAPIAGGPAAAWMSGLVIVALRCRRR